MIKTDVLIVGSGPAGSALGYMLGHAGRRCLTVDKVEFPRDKLCGGLVTAKTREIIHEIYANDDFYSSAVVSEFNELSLNSIGNCKPLTLKTKESISVVNRKEFDNILLEKSIYRGCGHLTGTVIEIDFENKVAYLLGGRAISFSILVGADGIQSVIRKRINPFYKPSHFCLEGHFVSDIRELKIYPSVLKDGYGWVIPGKGNMVTIGCGGKMQDKKVNEAFYAILKDCGLEQNGSVKGWCLNLYNQGLRRYCAESQTFLIGDAAGLADALTGEGLYYAFKSAKDLAISIITGDYYAYTLGLREVHKRMQLMHGVSICKDVYYSLTKHQPTVLKNWLEYGVDNCIQHYNVKPFNVPFSYMHSEYHTKEDK